MTKEAERSVIESSAEMRERERIGLRKPMKLNLSDEWCLEMARRELELAATAAPPTVSNGNRTEGE